MRILFTGFDPFGGEKINPAGEAVKTTKNIYITRICINKKIYLENRKNVCMIPLLIQQINEPF